MTDKEIIQHVIEIWAGRLSEKTLQNYGRTFEEFAKFTGIANGQDPAAAILEYFHDLKKDGFVTANAKVTAFLSSKGGAPASRNQYLAAIRSLLKTAHNAEFIRWTLCVEYVPNEPYRDTTGPNKKELRLIFKALKENVYKGPRKARARLFRDRAIFTLMIYSALRRVEVARLKVRDYSPSARSISILPKGATQQTNKPLNKETRKQILRWLTWREDLIHPKNPSMFDMRPDSITEMVIRRGQAAGLQITPHKLRHASTTQVLIATDGDLRVAQEHGGWKKADTVRIYDDNRKKISGEGARILGDALPFKE